jgi:hypothetical protein
MAFLGVFNRLANERPPIATAKVERAKCELDAGKGVRQVARLAGISAASVSRLKNSIVAPGIST